MVLRFGRCYSHGGIVTNADPLTIVHAYSPGAPRARGGDRSSNSVLSDAARAPRFFSLWAKQAMSGLQLFGGGSQPATTPDYTGLQIQTAVNTLPIPIVWGMSKLAPNVIWYNNFQTHYGGGKGGRQRRPVRRRQQPASTPTAPR